MSRQLRLIPSVDFIFLTRIFALHSPIPTLFTAVAMAANSDLTSAKETEIQIKI